MSIRFIWKELSDFNIDTISDLLDLIDHPKVAIELAIVSGNTVAKIASKCIKEDSLASWLQSILGQYEGKDFTQLCVVTGCLNYFQPNQHSFLIPDTLSIVLRSCQQQTNHAYQSFQALKLWSLKAKQGTVFENHPKCRFWILAFSTIFLIYLKLTCLVTPFDRKL